MDAKGQETVDIKKKQDIDEIGLYPTVGYLRLIIMKFVKGSIHFYVKYEQHC